MFVGKKHQDTLHECVRQFVIALQRDNEPQATEVLRRLYATVDELDDQLRKHLEEKKNAPKPKFHPQHQKASRLQQTRYGGKPKAEAPSEDK